eukprot:m.60451 g.60451  ORF g.60451 m.60451 type:complete len:264 (+) comp13663_c0_seq2:277-1068(+)
MDESHEKSFRELLAKEDLSDIPEAKDVDKYTIGRFVRARKLDVPAAVKQYLDTMRWRKDNVPADILGPDADEAIYEAICPHRNHGFDKEGRPIYFEITGRIKLPHLLKYVTPEKLIRRHIRQQEIAMSRMRESSQRLGRNVDTQVVIMDLAELSLKPNSSGVGIFKECIRLDQNYYPETLYKIFLVNAPWIFTPLWALLRPWLDPVTRAKFHVLGSNYQSVLLEYIDPEELPEEYGGKCQKCKQGCIPVVKPYLGPAIRDGEE